MNKRLLGVMTSCALGSGLLVGGTTTAQAVTVTACVKKKTGTVRIVTAAKKCKKGWKKVSWDQTGATGPQGPQGATGPELMVKSGDGAVLGRFLGVYPAGISIFFVQINGGIFLYGANGQVLPLVSQSADYKNSSCTGTPVVQANDPIYRDIFTKSAGGPTRITYRQSTPAVGAIRAWEYTPTVETVNQQLYKWSPSNTCVADGAVYNGQVVQLREVAPPQDVPGPLTIG